MAYIKNIGGRGAGGGGASGMFQRPGSLNNNVAQAEAEAAATKSNPAARVKKLARGAEIRAIDSLAMKRRVQALARGQEVKMGQDLAKQAASGKAAHEGLSNTAKGARGKAFYTKQKLTKAKATKGSKPTGLAAIPKGEVPGTGRGYTDVAGKGPKAPVLGKGGRNQVSPAGQSAYEKATGKSMFGPNGEGMPSRQRAAWARKNQGM